MKTGTTTLAGLVLISLVFSASHLYADITVAYPRNPATIHVTELAVDTPKCVSTKPYSTWSYNVTWKPVFNTWTQGVAPYMWKHYEVRSNGCLASIVMCDAMCQVVVSGCSWKVGIEWTKVAVYSTEEEGQSFGMSVISGMLRPPMKKVVTKKGTTVVCSNP